MPIAHGEPDASLILARQLIAAKLNIAAGSDPTTIGTTVADADRLLAQFGGKLPHGIAPSSDLGRSMVSDGESLASYSRGRQTPTCVRSSQMRRAAAAAGITARPDPSSSRPVSADR